MLSDPVLFIKLILSYFSASWLSYLEPASFSDNQCKFSLKLLFCLWVLCVIFRLHGISTFPFTLQCAIRHLTLLNINFPSWDSAPFGFYDIRWDVFSFSPLWSTTLSVLLASCSLPTCYAWTISDKCWPLILHTSLFSFSLCLSPFLLSFLPTSHGYFFAYGIS